MADAPLLIARPDGQLAAERALATPIMAPRLQGEFSADGRIDLSLWGAGHLGTVRFGALAGPFVHGPNRVLAPAGGLFVAQSAPVLVVRGVSPTGMTAATRSAPWDQLVNAERAIEREAGRWTCRLGWGCLKVETRGPDLVMAVGDDHAEADRGLTLSVDAIVAEAAAHVARCDRMPEADPVLRSLVMHGVHAGLSSHRLDRAGAFAGLAAGLAYSAPARSYFRDGYWTLQLFLALDPDVARQEIQVLAQGVHGDGEAPSGVIVSGPAQSAAWEARRQASPLAGAVHAVAGDWWSDHFDSPLFLVLALGDYADATGDRTLLENCWPVVQSVFRRYRALADADPAGLPRKPRDDRDWADNVYRDGYVAYDLGLWIGALDVLARLGCDLDPALAADAKALAARARGNLDAVLWRDGWYADYLRADGSAEPHLTLDSLMLLRYDAAAPERAGPVLAAARETLESRRNASQPWGDWGVMCAYPPFGRRQDLRAKSAFAYRYHNGGDWPWLDGVYARERLRRGLGGWRYPLTRWWESSLAAGWPGAVEYFSPPYGRGSLLQGWSSYPASVALAFRDQVLAGDRDRD